MTSLNPIHLSVALDGAGWHPAAWREPSSRPRDLFTADYWVGLANIAERGLLDFVTIEDSLTLQSAKPSGPDPRIDEVRGRLDASLIAATLAPRTRHIGLIPTVTVTHTEPFHVSKALATLDYTSHGRAGWQVKVSGRPDEAAHFGRRAIPKLNLGDISPDTVADLFDEGADAVDVVRQLWDSWEDDAEIRDVVNRRFIDRHKIHTIDFQSRFFSVRGPSITPRPPQGQPVVSLLAHHRVPYELAAKGADLVFVTPKDDADARAVLEKVRDAERGAGGRAEPLRVYADLVVYLQTATESGLHRRQRLDTLAGADYISDAAIFTGAAADLADLLEGWHALGYDGFRLRPGVATDDLPLISDVLVPELQRRGIFRRAYPDTSLRGLLGLPTQVPNRHIQSVA